MSCLRIDMAIPQKEKDLPIGNSPYPALGALYREDQPRFSDFMILHPT